MPSIAVDSLQQPNPSDGAASASIDLSSLSNAPPESSLSIDIAHADTSLCNRSMFSGYTPALTHHLDVTPLLYALYLRAWKTAAAAVRVAAKAPAAARSAAAVALQGLAKWVTSTPIVDKSSAIDSLPVSPRPWLSWLFRSSNLALGKLGTLLAPWVLPALRQASSSSWKACWSGKAKAVSSLLCHSGRSLSSFPLNSHSTGDLLSFDSDEATSATTAVPIPSSTEAQRWQAAAASEGSTDGSFDEDADGWEYSQSHRFGGAAAYSRSDSLASSGGTSVKGGAGGGRKVGLMRRVLKLATAAGLPLAHVWLAGRAGSLPPPAPSASTSANRSSFATGSSAVQSRASSMSSPHYRHQQQRQLRSRALIDVMFGFQPQRSPPPMAKNSAESMAASPIGSQQSTTRRLPEIREDESMRRRSHLSSRRGLESDLFM